MCELLGFSSKKKRRLNDLLREFYSNAEAHPHGWGLARFPDGGVPSVEKEAACATRSDALKSMLAEPVPNPTSTAPAKRTVERTRSLYLFSLIWIYSWAMNRTPISMNK